MLVHQLLERSAQASPDAVALIEVRRVSTYGDLERLANRFANLFLSTGLRRGDRVVIAIENCLEMVAAYLGAMKSGGVAVPLPAGPRSDRLARAIADCSPAICVTDAATSEDLMAAHVCTGAATTFVLKRSARPADGVAAAFADLDRALADASDQAPDVRSIDIDLAAIIYTSGSTGEPRGVMLTHRNIVANTRSIVSYLGLTSRDRVMCVLPFYYVYGLSLLHTHLAVGGSIVIDNRFAFPNVVLRAMQDHEVTGFAGVPSTFVLLLNRSNLDDTPLPALRYVTQAGGALPAARILEWLRRGPTADFYVMYGATEASARLTYLEPSQLTEKIGSIGKAISNVEILVLRDDGTAAPAGQVGELVARGANIAIGYWNNPEETRQKFDPLGYRTGDLGYVDEDGYIFLVGRRHDMIKVGAHRVGSKEIEDVLHEHPGVLEAAVVGVPHEILGEAPVAAVVPRSDALDTEALRGFCHQRLAGHKVPISFRFVTELPKTSGVGKIDKVTLRRQLTERLDSHARTSVTSYGS